ncbi:hypothetical protein ACEUAY_03000 [Aeromonas veronii]
MSAVNDFDVWFSKLPKSEQEEVLAHIFKEKVIVATEGIYTGPSGKQLIKGMYVGPYGSTSVQKCSSCGRSI